MSKQEEIRPRTPEAEKAHKELLKRCEVGLKREEIREGIRKLLADLYCGHGAWIHVDDITKILSYLHENDVAIKVDRELPQNPFRDVSFQQAVGWDTGKFDTLKAGYVAVEPLIEEQKKK